MTDVGESGRGTDRFDVLGVGVSRTDLERAVQRILDRLARVEKGYVCFSTAHGVSEAQADPGLRAIYNAACLNAPDGMPLVWLGRWLAGPGVGRVYGPDLLVALCAATEGTAYTHFFYGGAPGVAAILARRLRERFPGLRVAGWEAPPFRPLDPAEEAGLVRRVGELRPSLFWVGLGTPKQERFMAQYLSRLDTTVMLGVGAAFDFHAGRVRQAPRFVQRSGFEWLFRLGQEPRRLWRRYLRHNPAFVLRVLGQLTGVWRPPRAS